MEYTPFSPFKRPMTHAHLAVIDMPEASACDTPVNKWEVFRELSKTQTAFGITERDLTVLQGLLSFFPGDTLGGSAPMIVFPSNTAICERLNGMPCSTMRRHLARLVDAGLLLRRDSPNGKRYQRREGAARIAFGFDLAPLFRRAAEIAQAADAVRETAQRLRRLREVVSLMRRDLAAIAEYGEELHPGLGLWDQLRDTAALTARALRRRLSQDDLARIQHQLARLLDQARDQIDGPKAEELVTSDAQIEQHHLNSDKEDIDSDHCEERDQPGTGQPGDLPNDGDTGNEKTEPPQPPRIPLHLVTSSCPSIAVYYQGEIRHWHQLYAAACHVRPTMGISAAAWEEAQKFMGPEHAAVVIVAMLERFAEIRSPGGYLRFLTRKAVNGQFSCGPMVMALTARRQAA